jgi:hypothetical protein
MNYDTFVLKCANMAATQCTSDAKRKRLKQQQQKYKEQEEVRPGRGYFFVFQQSHSMTTA